MKEYFGEPSTLVDGWWENTAIGRFQSSDWPWLEHESLGWLYLDDPAGNPENGYWLYDFSFGWLHTAPGFYPSFWSEERGWILHLSGDPATRWFYDFSDGSWFTR